MAEQTQKPKQKNRNDKSRKVCARELASKVLTHVDESAGRAREGLDEGIRRYHMVGGESSLVTELVYGVLRRRASLDYYIGSVSSRPVDELSPWVRNLLRVALYQVVYLDRIPQSAAVDRAVEITKIHGHEGVVKFVNGVLRGFCRLKADDKLKALPTDPVAALAVEYSQPEWLSRSLVEKFGFEKTKLFMLACNESPPLTLRSNPNRISRDDLVARLVEAGYQAQACVFSEQGLQVRKGGDVQKMPGFDEGHFFVQDESSQLIVRLLDLKPGWNVGDVCAAPGGKSTHMAEVLGASGVVWAFDRKSQGIHRLNQSLERLGLKNVRAQVNDALNPREDLLGSLDAVLVDAPCSGLGVLRRRVESRWQIKPEDIKRQVELQKNILGASATYLRPGGVLVYSTCTLEERENEEVVKDFLDRYDNFKFERASAWLPPELVTAEGYYRSWPGQEGMDGFFGARMVKIK